MPRCERLSELLVHGPFVPASMFNLAIQNERSRTWIEGQPCEPHQPIGGLHTPEGTHQSVNHVPPGTFHGGNTVPSWTFHRAQARLTTNPTGRAPRQSFEPP